MIFIPDIFVKKMSKAGIVNVEKNNNNKIEVSDTSFSFIYKNSFSFFLYSTSSFLSFFITFSATHVPSLQIIFIAPAVAAFRFSLKEGVEAKMETETFNAEFFPSSFFLLTVGFILSHRHRNTFFFLHVTKVLTLKFNFHYFSFHFVHLLLA